jgi:hypothetical protein
MPRSELSAVRLFWQALLVLSVLGALLSIAGGPSGPMAAGFIILLALPLVQLGAAVVTALILAMSEFPDKSYQFRQLGKIVLGLVVGTVLGILAMVLVGMALSH